MTELVLDGCRVAPLGSYLQALGMLRVTTRLLDIDAAGHWAAQRFVVSGRFASTGDLVEELVTRFEPGTILSPWNAGSGFAGNGKNVTAERALQRVRESDDPRLARLRAAVGAADGVVRTGRELGWGGKGDELWDKKHKVTLLRLYRNRLPDDALAWVDAAVALGNEEERTYSRLLGTGGVFGRQDLSATYLQRLLSVLEDRRSHDWLRAALTGDESVPYLRDAVGQFDPSRAGGIQSSPWEKADDKGFVNPWSFLLTLEGALLFAGAVVRRLGAQFARPSLPFQVRGSTAGFDSAAGDETVLGEIWVPEWTRPATLAEVQHLLAEGRAEWRAGPARTGLDFARAVATLGVDRGIDAFDRHVFVDRHGQNPLAVPAGRILVRERGEVGLLAEIDPWLARLGADTMPGDIQAGVRRVEQALFALAARGGTHRLVEVFVTVGRLHEAAARSSAARAAGPPLLLPRGDPLLTTLTQDGPAGSDGELRVALALVTLQDRARPGLAEDLRTLRPLLQPVVADGAVARWAPGPALAPLHAGVAQALAEAARRRAFPGVVPEPMTDIEPAVRGVRIAYESGLALAAADRMAFVGGELDETRLSYLVAGLLCVSWPRRERASLPGGSAALPDPALDLLLLFTAAEPTPLLVRPGSWWPAALVAGHTDEVLADARRRVRLAGQRFVINSRPPSADGAHLAASLLLRSTPASRTHALGRVARSDDEERIA